MAGILKVDQVQSDSNLSFQVAGANVAYMNSTGLQMTGGSLSLAGTTVIPGIGQYAFPATQNPSADANTLDDYEEGTWTPVLTALGGTTPTGVVYDIYRYGRYTKIGRIVHFRATIVITSKGGVGSGDVAITGLPFSASDFTGYAYQPNSVFYYPASGITGLITGVIYDLGSTIYLSTGNAGTNIQWSTLSNSEKISINGVYQTT